MSADLEAPSTLPDTAAAGPARETVSPTAARPREVSHWIYFLLSVVIVFLSFTMSAPGERQVYLPGTNMPLPGLCLTQTTLGVDCPGCGMTRCFISLAHGQIGRAWHFNPAGLIFFLVVASQIPFQLAQIARIRTGREPLRSVIFVWLMGAVGVCMILQWAVKMLNLWLA